MSHLLSDKLVSEVNIKSELEVGEALSLVTGVDTKGRRGRGTKAKKADEASTHGSHPLSAVMLLLMQREPERDDRGREGESMPCL